MFCYRDRTFCPFKDCKKFNECERALTEEVIKKANEWMENAPISQFVDEPECFEKEDENEST